MEKNKSNKNIFIGLAVVAVIIGILLVLYFTLTPHKSTSSSGEKQTDLKQEDKGQEDKGQEDKGQEEEPSIPFSCDNCADAIDALDIAVPGISSMDAGLSDANVTNYTTALKNTVEKCTKPDNSFCTGWDPTKYSDYKVCIDSSDCVNIPSGKSWGSCNHNRCSYQAKSDTYNYGCCRPSEIGSANTSIGPHYACDRKWGIGNFKENQDCNQHDCKKNNFYNMAPINAMPIPPNSQPGPWYDKILVANLRGNTNHNNKKKCIEDTDNVCGSYTYVKNSDGSLNKNKFRLVTKDDCTEDSPIFNGCACTGCNPNYKPSAGRAKVVGKNCDKCNLSNYYVYDDPDEGKICITCENSDEVPLKSNNKMILVPDADAGNVTGKKDVKKRTPICVNKCDDNTVFTDASSYIPLIDDSCKPNLNKPTWNPYTELPITHEQPSVCSNGVCSFCPSKYEYGIITNNCSGGYVDGTPACIKNSQTDFIKIPSSSTQPGSGIPPVWCPKDLSNNKTCTKKGTPTQCYTACSTTGCKVDNACIGKKPGQSVNNGKECYANYMCYNDHGQDQTGSGSVHKTADSPFPNTAPKMCSNSSCYVQTDELNSNNCQSSSLCDGHVENSSQRYPTGSPKAGQLIPGAKTCYTNKISCCSAISGCGPVNLNNCFTS